MDKKVMRYKQWLAENELVDQGLAGAAGAQSHADEIPAAGTLPGETDADGNPIPAVCMEPPAGEVIKGGLADNKTVEDIAAKHNVTVDEINAQIEKGVKVESEHTDSPEAAKEIAKDHLMEDPKYYDKLETIEEEPKEPADEIKGKTKPDEE